MMKITSNHSIDLLCDGKNVPPYYSGLVPAILSSSGDRKLRRRQFETYFNIHMKR